MMFERLFSDETVSRRGVQVKYRQSGERYIAEIVLIKFFYDYPFSTPTKNAVNKRIIERHMPRTLNSV